VEVLAGGLQPALVLLDLNLPGGTGWDLLRGPALAAAGWPPVVITSAVTINPHRLAEYGVAGYLPKPFAVETLLSTVERLTHPSERHA
jgi:DNA-binding response OmpR family regulator